MKQANLRQLSVKEAQDIYKRHMKTDFPPDELKPFSMIKRHMKGGRYVCFEVISDGLAVGYAYLLKSSDEKYLLLDYFAVYKDLRGQGFGSLALNAVKEQAFKSKKTLILESEDEAFAENEADRKTRKRRMDFYIKNGMILSGVKTCLVGVNYRLFTYPEADAEKAIKSVYETMLPKRLLPKFLNITEEKRQ